MEKDLLAYIEMYASFFKNPVELFLLKHGRFYPGQKCPRKRSTPGECFANAGRLSLFSETLTYVEGYGCKFGLIPLHHAWCIDEYGYVVDTTWENSETTTYYGVEFDTTTVQRESCKNRVWGLLYPNGFANVEFIERYSTRKEKEIERYSTRKEKENV